MGRSEEAEKTCYELFRLSLRNRYPELQASALNFLAQLADQRGDQELRLANLNQALHLLRERNLLFPYTQALLNRAFFFWEQKRATPAELDATYALDLAERQKAPHFLAWGQLLLGRILRDRPKPDLAEAARYLNRAHQAIHRLGNRQLLWEVEFDRGLVAKKRGADEEARAFFERARLHLEKLMEEVPEFVRNSYLRDRKMERILEQLSELKS